MFSKTNKIARTRRARAISLSLKKFTNAYLFQIALEIMWQRINSIHEKIRDKLS